MSVLLAHTTVIQTQPAPILKIALLVHVILASQVTEGLLQVLLKSAMQGTLSCEKKTFIKGVSVDSV